MRGLGIAHHFAACHLQAGLRISQLHLNQISSPCESFESIQHMAQVVFPGNEAIQNVFFQELIRFNL